MKLKYILSLGILGLAATTQAAFLLGVDNVEHEFSAYNTETEETITGSVSENISALTYAGGNTYYGVVNTEDHTDLYCYNLVLDAGQITYDDPTVLTIDPVIGPLGGLSYVDEQLLTIENDPHFNNETGERYGVLFSIDPETGVATYQEQYDVKTEVEGLAYDGDGHLYYAETAYGDDSWVGAVDLTDDDEDLFFGLDSKIADTDVTGLAYVDGVLYGVNDSGTFTFDTVTGGATELTTEWGVDIDALTVFAGVEVPEPGSVVAFLLLLALPLWRRHRAAA